MEREPKVAVLYVLPMLRPQYAITLNGGGIAIVTFPQLPAHGAGKQLEAVFPVSIPVTAGKLTL
jgi:hypothetical protein